MLAGTPSHVAKQRYNEWHAEVEGRVAAIRATRDGTGLSLTRSRRGTSRATGIALTHAARDLFLDYLYEDLAAALRRLLRLANGDYSPET